MTLARAAKITDLNIIQLTPGAFHFRATGLLGQVDVQAKSEKLAAQTIVDWNWGLASSKVRRRQGHRCLKCKGLKPLSVHHVIFRSQGRRDVVDNLIALCAHCHEAEHRGKL